MAHALDRKGDADGREASCDGASRLLRRAILYDEDVLELTGVEAGEACSDIPHLEEERGMSFAFSTVRSLKSYRSRMRSQWCSSSRGRPGHRVRGSCDNHRGPSGCDRRADRTEANAQGGAGHSARVAMTWSDPDRPVSSLQLAVPRSESPRRPSSKVIWVNPVPHQTSTLSMPRIHQTVGILRRGGRSGTRLKMRSVPCPRRYGRSTSRAVSRLKPTMAGEDPGRRGWKYMSGNR